MSGWIKLHRKIWEWPYANDPDYIAIWIYLLTHASHQERDVMFAGKRTTLKCGQLVTGRQAISEKTGVTQSKVQRVLKRLESEQQIEQQTSNRNRLISLAGWESYQASEQQIEQQMNNHRTTDEQPVNTNKNDKKKRMVTKEKKGTNVPKEKMASAEDVAIPENLDTEDFREAWEEWLQYRAELKQKVTAISAKKQLKQLKQHSPEEAVKIIENSIANSWKGLFPESIKSKDNTPKRYPFNQRVFRRDKGDPRYNPVNYPFYEWLLGKTFYVDDERKRVFDENGTHRTDLFVDTDGLVEKW